MNTRKQRRGPRGSVRVVGGRWRGRRIAVDAELVARPTPDRVRETLFNWIAPVIEGSLCLDLYAGTGALGIEALSRGAREVWFVERDAPTAERLAATLESFSADGDRIVVADANAFLRGKPKAFDIVFLDPPFDSNVLENLCTLLQPDWLAPGALVYLETSRSGRLPVLPEQWTLVRERTAGQVLFALAKRG